MNNFRLVVQKTNISTGEKMSHMKARIDSK